MQKKAIRTTDKETIYLSYFPLSFERLPNNIPIVFFLVGIFGGTYAYYSQQFAKMVNQLGWKFVIVNRRGWDFNEIQSEKIFHENDISDIYQAIQ